jgi:hypothetical protein
MSRARQNDVARRLHSVLGGYRFLQHSFSLEDPANLLGASHDVASRKPDLCEALMFENSVHHPQQHNPRAQSMPTLKETDFVNDVFPGVAGTV